MSDIDYSQSVASMMFGLIDTGSMSDERRRELFNASAHRIWADLPIDNEQFKLVCLQRLRDAVATHKFWLEIYEMLLDGFESNKTFAEMIVMNEPVEPVYPEIEDLKKRIKSEVYDLKTKYHPSDYCRIVIVMSTEAHCVWKEWLDSRSTVMGDDGPNMLPPGTIVPYHGIKIEVEDMDEDYHIQYPSNLKKR